MQIGFESTLCNQQSAISNRQTGDKIEKTVSAMLPPLEFPDSI
jgi:hypothetical protein